MPDSAPAPALPPLLAVEAKPGGMETGAVPEPLLNPPWLLPDPPEQLRDLLWELECPFSREPPG